ncbi:MAG: glycosyltransferase family 4 protein [Clostridia bacterium]|nr:glycosyltransferase family 4 protein [Clostridia bacterium]
MKIVHIAPNAVYNDYWGYQDNLLPKYHRKAGHDVTVIVPNKQHNGGQIVSTECVDYMLNDGVRVIRLQHKKYIHRILSNLNSKLEVYPYLEKIKPDFVFFHGLCSSSILDVVRYKKRINPKCVIVQDNHADYYNANERTGIRGKLIRGYYRYIARRVASDISKVYGVTPWRKQYAEDYFKISPQKTDVLIMGADDELIRFDQKEEISARIKKENNILPSDFVIVTGGKIDRTKNIHLLMRAVQELAVPEIKLIVFGQPNDEMVSEIKFLSQSDNISFVGWIPSNKVYDYFLTADLGVFPGTHSVLWEQACACGLPMLFKDWEGMHHVFVNGNSEFLDQATVEEIKEKLLVIFKDKQKYSAMKQAAETCKKDFFYSEIAKKAIECSVEK